MRPIIAGQAGIADPTSEQCEQFRYTHPNIIRIEELDKDTIIPIVVSEASSRLYTNLFGQHSNRESWYNLYNRVVKNKLPARKEFRKRYHIPPLDPRLGLNRRFKRTTGGPKGKQPLLYKAPRRTQSSDKFVDPRDDNDKATERSRISIDDN